MLKRKYKIVRGAIRMHYGSPRRLFLSITGSLEEKENLEWSFGNDISTASRDIRAKDHNIFWD